ncbi:phage tail tape measure protein [Bacillus methanolicus]|uniref:phage tail tape measure protein n=1 Tax=Bacillus methanolicus TaxID=1471 RepID=UPI00237FDFA0|nr:phage tail tape measure protein [Bacillus methanolicus]MDE3838662.1 phage tail tape measure protein [Bacillus methanolicus]
MTEVGALRINLSLNAANFTQGMQEINRKLKGLQSEFRASVAGNKDFQSSLEGMRTKSQYLSNVLNLQSQRVEQLRRQYEQMKTTKGEDAKETENLLIRYNRALATMRETEHELRELNAQLERQSSITGRIQASMSRLGNSMQDVGGRMQSVGQEIAMSFGTVSTAIGGALGFAVKKSMDFEAQLSSIKAVSGATGEQMEQLKNLAIEMGSKTKYSGLEAAQGIEELIKAGVSLEDIINGGLEGALSLATAGELDLAQAAEIASTALNAFKDDALTINDAANILAGGANASATSVGELQFGLSQVSAVASGIGLSFKDTATALSLFANNGLKGSDAGTSLKTMLSNLIPKSEAANETMMDLGIVTRDGANAFFDAQGNVRSMAEIAGVLHESLKGLNAEQRQQALYTMFGSDAIRAANILYKEGAVGINKMYSEMSKVTAVDVANEKMNNLKGRIEELKGAFETAQITIGNALVPAVDLLVQGLQKVMNWFNNLSPGMQSFIAISAAVTAVITGLVATFGVVLAVIGGAASGIGALTTAFSAVSGAIASAGGIAGVFSTAIAAITGPIGIAVAAIVGLGVTFGVLYSKNEAFRNGVQQVWQHIKNIFSTTLSAIGSVVRSTMSTVTSFFSSKLQQIRQFWQQNGAQIQKVMSVVMTFISAIVQTKMALIQAGFTAAWNVIKGVTSAVWNTIKGVISGGINIILGLIKTFVSILTGDWRGAWEGAKQTVKGAIQTIGSMANGMVDIGRNIISGLTRGLSSAAKGLYEKAQDIANTVSKTIKNTLKIKSPSRVMIEMGKFIGQGLSKGMESSIIDIESISQKMANATIPDIKSFTVPNSSHNKMTKDKQIILNFERMFEGANFHVRDDYDIHRIAEEMGNVFSNSMRTAGVRI